MSINLMLNLVLIFLSLTVLLSPIIFFYAFLNIKYDLEDEKLVVRFLGIKYLEIYYSNIEDIEKLQLTPYLSSKNRLNNPIKLYLKKRPKFGLFKISMLYPKDYERFYEELKIKCQNVTK